MAHVKVHFIAIKIGIVGSSDGEIEAERAVRQHCVAANTERKQERKEAKETINTSYNDQTKQLASNEMPHL